jgi:hypothetical protein
MSCPLFVDFTRECTERFDYMIHYQNYDICQSDSFADCPNYQVIKSDFNCKFLDKCARCYTEETPKFIMKAFSDKKVLNIIKSLWESYCQNKLNYKNCERYKKYDQGETPSYKLFPDGKSHYLDIIFGKVITVK